MGEIVEIKIEEKQRWDETVRKIANYDVFYLSDYVTAFWQENKQNGIPMLLYYQNGAEQAIYVGFKRDVAFDPHFEGKIEMNTYFDLISPYGYGGFLGNVQDYDELNRSFDAYCRQSGYICEFVRFELFSDYCKHYGGEVETRTHNVIRNLEASEEEIWMDFKQKVRKNVNRAKQCGLEIRIENTTEHLDDFLEIYYSTMERNTADSGFYFSKEFFETIGLMQDNICFFYALHEGKAISTELVIFGAEQAYSYLGGTLREYFDMRPNDYLKYEIIKWAKQRGLKNFVLGGGYGSDDGIFQYKASLAPHGIVDFYIGRKIFDAERYRELLEMRKEDTPDIESKAFFPKYRA